VRFGRKLPRVVQGCTHTVRQWAGSRRKAAVEQMLNALGGKVEAFYFALGDSDVYVIVDVPDTASGAAPSLAVNASGTVRLSTIMLMTPEEVDVACKKTVNYRAPGQ
jgi:uncharacterized protein with GYD domain